MFLLFLKTFKKCLGIWKKGLKIGETWFTYFRQNGLLAGRWQMCCPISSQINIRQSQTLPNIKMDQYKQLSCQPKPSQASPDASDRASEYPRFSTFWKSVK